MKCSQLYRILTKDGWYAVSQKGSHVKMRHETKKRNDYFPEPRKSRNG
nr:type II toxin-antitoxin system HicA family toxin [Dokdonia sinensis]